MNIDLWELTIVRTTSEYSTVWYALLPKARRSSRRSFEDYSVIGQAALDRDYVHSVGVAEDYRRNGVATLLMQTLIEEARRRGITRLTLSATEMGRPVYAKLGFKSTRPDYPPYMELDLTKEEEDAILADRAPAGEPATCALPERLGVLAEQSELVPA